MFKRKILMSDLKSYLLGVLTFFACFENAYLTNKYSFFGKITVILETLLLGVFLILFVRKLIARGMNSVSQVSQYCIASCFLIAFSTFINRGYVFSGIVESARMLVVILLLEIVSKRKSNVYSVLYSWSFCLALVVLVDLITEIRYPGGLYGTDITSMNWFMGYKTARGLYSLPLGYITLYLSHKKYEKATVTWYILMSAIAYNAWLSQGIGLFVAVVVLVILIFFLEKVYKGNRKRILDRVTSFVFNYKLIFVLYIIITTLVVLQENSAVMLFISNLTGKSMTLSRRTIVWAMILPLIAKSPIIGYGYLSSKQYESIIGFRGGTNAHNMILALMMNGGVLLLMLYVMLFISSVRKKLSDYTLCDICLLIYIYATFLLGISSAVFVLSPYAFVFYWIFEYEKKTSL